MSARAAKRRKREMVVSSDVRALDASPELDALTSRWPGREVECVRLHSLLEEPERDLPLFVYGTTGGGKSGVVADVLSTLEIPRAIVDCVACATPRALYETCLNQLHGHRPCESNGYTSWRACEHPAQFVLGLQQLAEKHGRVCLVFERAERLQRQDKLLSTLLSLPSLVRMGRSDVLHVLPIFVAEALWQDFHRATEFRPVLCVGFGGYDRDQLAVILKRDSPSILAAASRPHGREGRAAQPLGLAAAFDAFLPLFVDFFSEVCRDLRELRYLCSEVFVQWTRPVREGRVHASDTSALYEEARGLLRGALKKVYAHDGSEKLSAGVGAIAPAALRLPSCSKYLLIAAHLASRFPPRLDEGFFSVVRRGAKQRRTKRMAPAEEPHAFTLERLLAIYDSIQPEDELQRANGLRVEALVQLATLIQQQLVVRVSAEGVLEGMRLRCEAPKDTLDVAADELKFDLKRYFED